MRRNTRQRTAVFAALERSDDFQSAQQLHSLMVESGEKVGLATIYRNLQLLAEGGMVDMIRSEDGEALYRKCDEAHHHHHLVCRVCQRSEEIHASEFEDWVETIAKQHGFTQVEHTADLFGLCQDCADSSD